MSRLFALFTFFASCFSAAPSLHAQTPGSFDPQFSITSLSYGYVGRLLVPQPDGKILMAGVVNSPGSDSPGPGLVRLQPDGTLDPTFHAAVQPDQITSIALQTDGRMIVCYPPSGISRLNSDGSKDPSFHPEFNYIVELAEVQSDGKILVSGTFTEVNGRSIGGLARLNADGSVDDTWNPGILSYRIHNFVLQDDGKVIVAGSRYLGESQFEDACERLNADGSRDETFHAEGGGYACLAPTADGKIVITKYLSPAHAQGRHCVRLLADGSIDPSFSYESDSLITALAIQNDGKVLIGFDDPVTAPQEPVVRLLSDGTVEDKVGFDCAISGGYQTDSISLQGDGKIFVALSAENVPQGYSRLLNDAATTTLVIDDPSRARWLRSGSAPVVTQVAFEWSPDGGTTWLPLGRGAAIDGGWKVEGIDLSGLHGILRARGRVLAKGVLLSGSGLVADTISFDFDTLTLSPVLTAPSPNAHLTKPVTVDFTLPEPALSGSVKLRFENAAGTTDLVLAPSMESAGRHTLTFDPANPTAAAEILSGTSLPDGTYSLTVSYQDTLAHAEASSSAVSFQIDTTPANLGGDFSPLVILPGPLPDFTPQVVSENGEAIDHLSQMPSPGTSVDGGSVEVTISALDAAGNPSAITFTVIVRPAAPRTSLILAEEAPPPAAGAPNGPPADALLADFDSPAIDEGERASEIVFVGKWMSPAAGRGSGIFTRHACLAKSGDRLPEIKGAKLASFSTPVIHQGTVICFARLSGTPASSNSVLLAGPVEGPLSVVARTGEIAPGTKNARWKRFLGADTRMGNILLSAQFEQGSPGTASAMHRALWIKNGSADFSLVLREGQHTDSGIVQTLVSLRGGDGSPGQGRGWLTVPNGVPTALARVIYRNGIQGLLEAGVDGQITQIARGSTAGDKGAAFKTLGLPVSNDAGHIAFAAKANREENSVPQKAVRGIFVRRSGLDFETVALQGEPALSNDAAFDVLKDPVLAEDGSIAFSAIVKGGGLSGAAAKTLWWQSAAGESSRLMAQGGQEPPGVPGGKWKSFDSLAIVANRGPLFTATLAVAPDGKHLPAVRGMWGTDITGQVRLLFRTGDSIEGKMVKQFEVLRAVRGGEGVARSVNGYEHVVWLATFTDGKKAIVMTEIP